MHRTRRYRTRAAVAALSLCGMIGLDAAPAAAQSCSATITPINYGSNVDVLPGTPVDTTATITFNCTGIANRTVRICAGLGRRTPTPAAGNTSRRMQHATLGTFLNHDLFTDVARTVKWGTYSGAAYGTGGVQIDIVLNGAGSGSAVRTIYARILASQQAAQPGTYTMTLSGTGHRYSDQYVGAASCPTGSFFNYANTAVTATIPGRCYMTTTPVNFGTHTLLTSAVAANGAIVPQCSNTLPYTVSLGGGLSGAVDPTQRKMAQGAKQVTYGLYRDATFLQPWGSTVGVNTVAGTGSGFSQSIPVYGRLPIQAVPATGLFSDSVVVTVTY